MPPFLRRALIFVAATAALAFGWSLFWFVCDDAYIAFRYVSNSDAGRGYVWNPPPFLPVEGYSSFLWVALLDVVWRVTGVEPPVAANPILLVASIGTLAVVAHMALSLAARLPLRTAPPELWMGLALLAVVSNRNTLTWASSGLETGLFNLLVVAWTAVGALGTDGPRRAHGLAALAALLYLCRPDGLLFLAATLALLAFEVRRAPGRALAALWLAIPAAHFAWRLSFYGYPLPNPAYAKHTGWWPDMGAAYLASFLLENGAWVPAIAFFVGAAAWTRVSHAAHDLARAIVPLTLVAQAAYYTILIGGDHFEYRVYLPLVTLLPVGLLWAAGERGWSPRTTVTAFALYFALGWPIQWAHWWHTHTLTAPKSDRTFRLAPHTPTPLRPIATAFDGLQAHMLSHMVGIRHQGHVIYAHHIQPATWPTRAQGALIDDPADVPVIARGGVGYPGWVLPNVAILDYRGLNDLVCARNPVRAQKSRAMAHDREAPKGYLACFEPNVSLDAESPTKLRVRARGAPLTAARIVACEQEFLEKVTRIARAGG